MGKTKIEWATRTWQVTAGCQKVSPGCGNCYAESMARRLSGNNVTDYLGTIRDGHWSGVVVPLANRLKEPDGYRDPQWVFVDSMSDLFHKSIPFEYIDRVMNVIERNLRHVFMVLTKRPERAFEYFNKHRTRPAPPNLILGTSVENQAAYVARAHWLARTNVETRFLSLEPLLGAVRLGEEAWKFAWFIVGGESGGGARPVEPKWVRDLRDQVKRMDKAFFFKQWGQWYPYERNKASQKLFPGSTHSHVVNEKQGSVMDCRVTKTVNLVNCGHSASVDCTHFIRAKRKTETGRVLDGRTWDELPEIKAVLK